MLGSIDCMHWKWKNCPTAWKEIFCFHGTCTRACSTSQLHSQRPRLYYGVLPCRWYLS
ncbi:putative harbinger transposase-derived protein [Helianthus anomalus]